MAEREASAGASPVVHSARVSAFIAVVMGVGLLRGRERGGKRRVGMGWTGGIEAAGVQGRPPPLPGRRGSKRPAAAASLLSQLTLPKLWLEGERGRRGTDALVSAERGCPSAFHQSTARKHTAHHHTPDHAPYLVHEALHEAQRALEWRGVDVREPQRCGKLPRPTGLWAAARRAKRTPAHHHILPWRPTACSRGCCSGSRPKQTGGRSSRTGCMGVGGWVGGGRWAG